MEKIAHKVGLASAAVLALVAFATAPAFAAEAEWLAGGNPITAGLAADSISQFSFVATISGVATVVDCSVLNELIIGPNHTDSLIDIYDLVGTLIGTLDTTDTAKTALDCEALSGACTGLANVWVVLLNLQLSQTWPSRIERMVDNSILDLQMGDFEVECVGALGKVEDTCEDAESDFTLTNEATDVKEVADEATIWGCTLGSGKFSGEGLITLTSGEALAVS